jgi:hypothetical protein
MTLVARMCACAVLIACTLSPVPSPAPAAPEPTTAPASPAPRMPTEELDIMDGRAPVPLLPAMASHQKQNMRDHLVAVQEVVTAVSLGDFASVEAATARIGFSPTMGQMCSHMGAGAPGFAEQAIEFHHTADRIGTAARERDGAAVLAALGTTLQACTSCHAAWKQRVVDEPTWQRLASAAPPTGH